MKRALLLPLAIAACHKGPPEVTEAQLAEIDRIANAAAAGDADGDRALQTAAQGLAALAPTERPCGVAFSVGPEGPFAEDLARWVAMSGAAPALLQAGRVTVAQRADQLGALTSASREVRRREARRLRAREAPYQELDAVALAARATELFGAPIEPELLIVLEASRDPKAIDDASFEGGLAIGRAYLYDGVARRFVCAGDVTAESSASVQIWRTRGLANADGAMITADLYLNLITRAQKSLRALP